MVTVLVKVNVSSIIAPICEIPEGLSPQINSAVALPSASVTNLGVFIVPNVELKVTFLFDKGLVSSSRTKMVIVEGSVPATSNGNARIKEFSTDGFSELVARVFLPNDEFMNTREINSAKDSRKTDMRPVSFLSILYCRTCI